jgi:hypothetical protein
MKKTWWSKDGKPYRDDIDPETGLTLPYSICYDEKKIKKWCKNNKLQRDDIDHATGFTLPTAIAQDGTQFWFKNNKLHRDEIDLVTMLPLPAIIWGGKEKKLKDTRVYFMRDFGIESKIPKNKFKPIKKMEWYKNGIQFIPGN